MAKYGPALALLLAACGGGDGDESSASTGPAGSSGGVVTTGGETPTTGVTGEPESTGETGQTGEPGSTGETTDSTGAPPDSSTGEPVGPMGHFLAVGDGGRRVRSVDGVAWDGQVGTGLLDTDEETAAPDALRALAVGDGYVVAVGGGGNFFVGNSMVMRSTDGGASWQEDLLKD